MQFTSASLKGASAQEAQVMCPLRTFRRARKSSRFNDFRSGKAGAWIALVLLGLPAVGCATAPLNQAGSLRSYADLKPSDGLLTRSLLRISKQDVLAAKTI